MEDKCFWLNDRLNDICHYKIINEDVSIKGSMEYNSRQMQTPYYPLGVTNLAQRIMFSI
jgi:hypothetical protein